MVGPGVGVVRLERPADEPDRPDGERLRAFVDYALLDGEQIAVVNRDLDRIARAIGRLGSQSHGMARREYSAVGRPNGVERWGALAAPAERGDISAWSAERRQQPNRRRILGDRLPLANQDEIVDLRALEVDRALQRGSRDLHSRRGAKHRRAGLKSL